MNWTRPGDLRAQLQRLWERGELLAALITREALFPKRLSLKVPTAAEMVDHFDAVRSWIGELRGMAHCRIEMREFSHRLLGVNALPQKVWIDTIEDAVAFIAKQRDLARFLAILETTRRLQPQLLAWLAKRPLRGLAFS